MSTHVPLQQVPPLTEVQTVPLVNGSHFPFLHFLWPFFFLHLPLLQLWHSGQSGLHLPEFAAFVSWGMREPSPSPAKRVSALRRLVHDPTTLDRASKRC